MAATVIPRDNAGGSLETYSRWRNRRNAMGNVMDGVQASHLRTLDTSLNHVIEHDTNERTTVEQPTSTVPETSTNGVIAGENDHNLAAVLGFPVHGTSPVNFEHEDHVELATQASDSNEEDSGEERERILRSPVHKRRRNALADALAVVDEESLHRIQRLHANASHCCHERW